VATAQGFRWEVRLGTVQVDDQVNGTPASVHPNVPTRDVHPGAHLGALVQVVGWLKRQTETQAKQISPS